VAKRIMEDHGGKIVASNHGEGALFQIYIPKKLKLQINE
jgi:nitrogen fixation/metabolism regulation signal transduction histidine kinase